MIPEFGLFSLVLALCVALTQLLVQWRTELAPVLTRTAATAQFLCITLAFAAFIFSHMDSDFTVANVVQNSHTAKPMFYKITGAWGNHEGSMLLWVWVLALYGFLFSLKRSPDPELQMRTLGVQSAICAGFLLFILFTSNPFTRIFPPPLNGEDLNPLLQDVGLALHPPMLYLGYVGNSMVFSLAIAALLQGKLDREWARLAHPWILLSWSILTIGIGLGSWWAYRELGWGGWWFWDPVENASLMPWLAGTALLHSNLVLEKRGHLKSWVLLLAIVTFSLSLLGTFLVRSGVLTSVHSFASDPARGLFILLYMAGVIGGALWLYASRLQRILSPAPPLQGSEKKFVPFSREGSIVINNLFLVTACATIMLATLYPMFLELLAQQKVSVGPPYFNATFFPIMAPLLLLAAIGPLLAWKTARLRRLRLPLLLIAGAGALADLLVWLNADSHVLGGMIGMGLAAWLMTGIGVSFVRRIGLFSDSLPVSIRRALHLPLRYYGMLGAHLGVALLAAGITGSALWKQETEQPIAPGQVIENFAGYRMSYTDEEKTAGENYTADRGHFTVTKNGRAVTVLAPESRYYPVRETRTTESAIYTTPLSDLYAVITKQEDGGSMARLYFNPLMLSVWAGFLLMGGGGLLSLISRNKIV